MSYKCSTTYEQQLFNLANNVATNIENLVLFQVISPDEIHQWYRRVKAQFPCISVALREKTIMY